MSLVGKQVNISVLESFGTVEAKVKAVDAANATVVFLHFGSVYQAIVPLSWVRTKLTKTEVQELEAKTRRTFKDPLSAALPIQAGSDVLVSMQIDTVVKRKGTVVEDCLHYLVLQTNADTQRAIPMHRIKDIVIVGTAAVLAAQAPVKTNRRR